MWAYVDGLFFHSVTNVTHLFDLHGSDELTIAMIHPHVDDSIRKESLIALKFCMTTYISLGDEHHIEVHGTKEVKEGEHLLSHDLIDGGERIDGSE